MSYRFIKTRE